MALYLDALSSRTGVTNVQGDDLSGALKHFVRAVAWDMANEGKDYVSLNRAEDIAAHHLRGRTPSVGGSWLNVFIGSNLLRRDPPPFSESIDPLDPPSDLVRFAYQRFQDFLMADALVDRVIANRKNGIAAWISRVCYKVVDVLRGIVGNQNIDRGASEFQRSGPLNFLFYSGDSDNELRYEYSGLVAALSTIYPERLGLEFAPALPDWKERWEHNQPVQLGFADSFKWRNTETFTECTRDLFNRLQEHPVDKLGLLLEVSMTVEHPWNAERLHRHLEPLELAQRDSEWTGWINWSSREEYSQIERIVTWALSSLGGATDARHLELASLVLGWSLSSTHVILRDQATKALTKVFLKRSITFDYLLDKLQNCNDPYVIERLYASAFGACCIDPSHARLNAYSTLIFSSVFADGNPPVGLMARDYALGVIELADHYIQLDTSINVSGCYHPFKSEAPAFGLTMCDLKQIAKESGGERILSSASSEVGDYGKYSIPGRVRSFLATPLGLPLPKSKDQIKQSCHEELIAPYPDRLAALEAYETAPFLPFLLNFELNDSQKLEEDAEQEQTENEETRETSRETLEALYGEEDVKRLGAEYFQDGLSRDAYEHVSIQQCRWWVTKRAYELGWTARLFPNDGHSANYSRYENDLERIGKKYQRIALDEIEARLADNFWYLESRDSNPQIYKYGHHDFRRNIEPTLLPDNPCLQIKQDDTDAWMIQPQIDLPEVAEDDLRDWLFLQDPSSNADEMLVRQGSDDSQWLVLYDHVHARENYSGLRQSDHSARIEEFRFFHCVFVPKGKGRVLASSLKRKNEIDSWTFKPPEYVDGPYLGEAFWRDTWETSMFSEETLQMGDKCSVAIPLASYQWESHLDRTLKNGFSIYLPQRWFAEEIGLKGHSNDYKTWCNQANEDIIKVYRSGEDHQSAVVVDRTSLLNYVADNELEAVWLFIAERNAWPGGDNSQARWRRSESAIWYDGLNWHKEHWFRDTLNS